MKPNRIEKCWFSVMTCRTTKSRNWNAFITKVSMNQAVELHINTNKNWKLTPWNFQVDFSYRSNKTYWRQRYLVFSFHVEQTYKSMSEHKASFAWGYLQSTSLYNILSDWTPIQCHPWSSSAWAPYPMAHPIKKSFNHEITFDLMQQLGRLFPKMCIYFTGY